MNARGRAGRSSSSELEHEWQFDADDLGAVRDWLESRLDDPDETPDGRLALLSAGSDELTDVYLDTSDAKLLHGGWSLRHRMARSLSPADSGRDEGERLRRVLTLKATRSEGTELRVRREIHELLTPIDDDALDTQSRLAVAAAHAARGERGEIGAEVGALVAGEALRPFCLVVTARRRYTLESLDGPCAEIALDDANVLPVAATNGDRSHDAPPTVSRPVSLLRVEIELAPRLGRPSDPSAVADRAAVDAFVERFARDVELSPSHASKLEIGLRAAGRKLDPAEAAFGGLGGDEDDDLDDDEDDDEDDVDDDHDDDLDDDEVEDAPDEDESDGELEVEPETDELDEDDAEFARTLRRLAPKPNLAVDPDLDELADEDDAADDDAGDEDAPDHRSRRQAPKPGSTSSIDALLDAIRASRAASAAPQPEKPRGRKAEPKTTKRGRKSADPQASNEPVRKEKRKRASSTARKPKRSARKRRTERTERVATASVPVRATPTVPPRTAPSATVIGEIGTLVLGADASASELAYVTLRKLYVALRGYEPGTRLGEDREELHQMRVATRRTRAALSFFADTLPPSGERFNAAWRRLGQSLGAVRDLDVLALDLQARLAAVDRTAAAEEKAGMTTGLNAVLAGLERRRRLLRRRMIERLDRVKTARLFRAYEQFLHAGEARANEDGELSAALFLPERLRRRRRKLQRSLRGLASTSPVGEFHAARILGKRLRYAVEFSGPIYGPVARAYARRLVPLQDLLGQVQDASIALTVWNDPRLASSLPSEGLVALGRLIEQARSESKRGRRRVRRRARLVRGKAWRAFRREVVALADAATRHEPGI